MSDFNSTSSHAHLAPLLTADCQTGTGSEIRSSVNLDDYLGNEKGAFKWGGTGFSFTAKNISLDGTVLTADLATGTGTEYKTVELNINKHIKNDKGYLKYVA